VPELPPGTLTFLFSDIEGSTQLLRRLRERYALVLADHRTLMRAAFAAHGGEEMGTEGDAFFVVFRRAGEAVAAAADAQRALAAHEWPDGEELRVRMGLNTGEPGLEEEGYFGLGLHLTARICSAAHGGQVLVSQSTCAVAQAEELDGIDLRDLGEHHLKDFDRPERLFQLVVDGLPSDFPPPRTLDKQAAADAAFRGEVGVPYKGLEAFQPQDAEFFFGREELVADLGRRLSGSAFLAVIGPSGSGKSSVVRAGLIPAIWSGAHGLAQGRDWRVVIMTPGPHPLEELAVRLATERGLSPGSVLEDLRRDPHNLCLAVRQLLLDQSQDAKVVLVVDQAEEVFTLCRDEEERRLFVELLAHAAEETAQTVVVLALRADFYGHCASYPALAALVQDHQSLVGPMRESEIRRAIELPAAKAGLRLEPGLVARILEDVGSQPGSLPLLSHALLETWSRRQDQTMTLGAYLDSGGVRGAIARTADAVYGELEPEQQEVARRIFLRLTEPGQGTEDTRRRASLAELLPGGDEQAAVEEVLDILARARLVTVGQDTVEVAHEALIREWPLLRRWLDEDREGLQIHRRLTDDSREWVRYERDPGLLYRGARLSAAQEWGEANTARLSAEEQAFLSACREAVEREAAARRRRQQILKAVAATLAVLLALAIAAAVFAAEQRGRAQGAERSARARALVQAAQGQLGRNVDRALLLGVQAERTRSTPDGRSMLLSAVQRAGRVLGWLRGSAGPVNDVAFSRDGRLLASIGDDERIRLWRPATRAPAGAPFGTAPGDALAFGAGGLLAVGGRDGVVRLWDVRTRRTVAQLPAAPRVADLAFSPSGDLLAAAAGDRVVVWNTGTRRRFGRPLAGVRGPTHVAFSGDGRLLAAAGIEAVSVWNVRTRKQTRIPVSSANAVAFAGNGTTLAVAANQGPLQLWNVAAQQAPPRRLTGFGTTSAVAFSPAGDRLAVGNPDGAVRLFDARTLRPLPVEPAGHTAAVNALAFSPDGARFASASDDHAVILGDARREPRSRQLAGPGVPATSVATGSNGIIAAARGPDVLVWRHPGDRPLTVAAGGPFLDVTLSADGTKLAASTQKGDVFVGGSGGANLRRLSTPGGNAAEPVVAVALSADGTKLAASLQNGQVLLQDAAAGRLGVALPAGTALPQVALDLSFSPDGRTLAAGRADGTIVRWDAASRRLLGKPVHAHADAVRSLAFTPDGAVLASAGGDPAVKLWHPDALSPFGEPLEGPAGVTAVRFAPDGNLAAAGTTAGSLVLFDVPSRGALGEPFAGHAGPVFSLAFAGDGTHVVTAGRDGRVLLWDVAPWADEDVLLERACSIVGRNLTRSEWDTYLPGKAYHRTCDQWPAGG
jgi:WD40 repeat protein/class 3 adenylate cyclase